MKKVILLSGKMQSGKNTLAKYLKLHFGNLRYKVTEDLFAIDLKNFCNEDFRALSILLNNYTEELKTKINLFLDQKILMLHKTNIYDIEKTIDKLKIDCDNWYENKTDITRTLLQIYGTNIIRNRVDNNFWVNCIKKRCVDSNSDIIIITDCRFPNEITNMYCDDYETITIRVERNTNIQSEYKFHESETALDDWKEWNYIVDNNGSVSDLGLSSLTIVNDMMDNNEY